MASGDDALAKTFACSYLSTADIPGAMPAKRFGFTQKPEKDFIPGSTSRSLILSWNRPVMNLTVNDIEGTHPVANHFLETTTRVTNPLTPSYQIASFKRIEPVRPRPANAPAPTCSGPMRGGGWKKTSIPC
jgi:hypothetical protein